MIPTADRHYLLAKTIPACLLSSYPNLEVLVSDNFSTPETSKVVDRFRSDSRLRYARTERRLAMPDHWEFAWRQSTGDFIIINSDDDGVSPRVIDQLANIAEGFHAELMSWDAGLYYHPDWELSGANTFTFMGGHSGMLLDIDPQAVFASYARLNIPICFPQGTRMCFSRSLAERARTRVGRVFWPPHCDYTAPLLFLGLLHDARYIYIDALLGYGGRSSRSNAASLEKEGRKTGNQERIRQYYDEFDQQDIYPHHDLKIRSLWNGYAATLNLVRHILPEAFVHHQVDPAALITAIECEFRGINIYNGFLGASERSIFEAFLAKHDPEIVAASMREVERRALYQSIERWHGRSKRSKLSRLISRVVQSPSLLVDGFFNPYAWRRLAEILRSPTSSEARTNPGDVHLQYMGRMLKIRCRDLDCHHALDLTRQLDRIVEKFDPCHLGNVEAFYKDGLLRAAYAQTNAPVPDESRRSR